MKHKLQVLLCFLLLSFGAFAQTIPSYVPTNGLVGWWPFNGNANDESGNGNHGTVNGATLTSDRNGVGGKAYYFSSANCATRIDANLNTTSIQSGLTISIWVLKSGNGCIGPRLLEIYNTVDGPGSAGWSWDNSNYATFGSQTSNGTYVYSTFNPKPNNVWTNLVYTNDGVKGRFYQDGVLINSVTSSGNPILGNIAAFGRMNHPAWDAFNGKLDDIAIYNRALSQIEITGLYTGIPQCTASSSNFNLTIPSTSLPYTWNGLTFTNSGSQTAHLSNTSGCDSSATLNLTVNYNIPSYIPTNGLVGWWPFNGNANDESGNGNHGTLLNGVTLSTDRNGVAGKAYSFDGVDDRIFVNKQFFDNGWSNFSISLWTKLNNISNTKNANYSNTLINTSPHNGLGFGANWGNNSKYSLWVGNGTPSVGWNVLFNSLSNQNSTTNWTHLVLIKNSTTYQLFINGVLDNSWSGSQVVSYFYKLYLGGGDPLNTNETLDGILDDVAIFNRALTQQEITALYTGVPPCTPNSSTTNLNIPSTNLPFTWNGLTFNTSGSQTAHLTNASGCDSAATLNLTVNYNIPSYVPTNGLVGWWPFNGNANDESGNGNHGTVNGAVLTSNRFGNSNKAYSFDLGGILCSNFNIPQNSSISISYWIKETDINGLISEVICLGSNSSTSWGTISSSGGFCMNYGRGCGSTGSSIITYNINRNQWHHVVIASNGLGTNSNCYVDGIFIGNSNNANKSGTCSATNLYFGVDIFSSPKYFKGSIDDIAIYNRVLTQQEITALYTGNTPCTPTSSNFNLTIPSTSLPYTWNGLTFTNSGSQTAHLTNASGCDSAATLNLTVNNTIPSYVPTNGLVGWWPFNGNANDESGNGNQGTVNGATLTSDRNGVQGKAYSFDGNDWIDALNPGPTGTGITLSYWFKSNQTNLGSVFCYGGNNWGTQFEILHNYWSAQTIGPCYGPALHNSGTLVSFNHNQYLNNNFHHVVFVLPKNATSLSSAYIYVDGNLIANYCSFANYGAPSPNIGSDYPIKIGKNINAGNGINFYNGILDDIAIYNRALTQAEITALYNGAIQITASSGANGSISPSGTTSVNAGSSQNYTFTPNPGYWVDSVFVNGVQVPTASSYTFNYVTSNQTIRVTYRSLAAALAAANICANDTLVATVNLPSSNFGRATVYYSNIFLFGGTGTNNAYKYNVNDRKYTAIANKPTACIECGVAEANGKIYCFNTNGTTQAYDIATNTWQVNATLPTAAGMNLGIYATSLNNLIYLTGGTFGLTQSSFYQYNPQTNAFTKLQDFSQPRVHTKLITYQNRIYAVGGEYFDGSNSIALSLFEVYNPSTNTWTVMPAMPEPLSSIGASIYNNKLYVFGGGVPYGKVSNKVYVFDFISNAWYLESNTLSVGRSNIEAKTANNMVFLFAGNDSTNHTSNQAIRYFCKDQLCTCKWAEYVCNGVSQNEPCPIPTSSLYRPGTVFCNGYATKVVDVTNPITGKTWMDRNLGASQAATSSTDAAAYGDLYQWGRGADGHQCRNSATTNTLSTTDQPGHGNFIVSPNTPYDWRSTQNDSLWQGVNGINNPCPSGYRVPTLNELIAERDTWIQNSGMRAFKSILKFPMSGGRYANDGLLSNLGSDGFCWSSTGTRDYYGNILHNILYFNGGPDLIVMHYSAYGLSVRCIKD
jgi:hypothetical protein